MVKNRTLIFIALCSLIGTVIGLMLALYFNTVQARARFENYEVTFVTPQQAIVFWKTKSPTLGYIKLGTNQAVRNTVLSQTSSVPSDIHAVLVEEIPPDGVYISLHDEGENGFILPEVRQIKYHEGVIEEGAND